MTPRISSRATSGTASVCAMPNARRTRASIAGGHGGSRAGRVRLATQGRASRRARRRAPPRTRARTRAQDPPRRPPRRRPRRPPFPCSATSVAAAPTPPVPRRSSERAGRRIGHEVDRRQECRRRLAAGPGRDERGIEDRGPGPALHDDEVIRAGPAPDLGQDRLRDPVRRDRPREAVQDPRDVLRGGAAARLARLDGPPARHARCSDDRQHPEDREVDRPIGRPQVEQDEDDEEAEGAGQQPPDTPDPALERIRDVEIGAESADEAHVPH